MRPPRLSSITAFLALALVCGLAAAEDANVVQKKLTEQFALTKTTADKSDIVTAGSVLVLHKDGLMMYSTATSAPALNVYKDGKIQRNEVKDRFNVLKNRFKIGNTDTSDVNSLAHRQFVSGEKFWVTSIDMQADGAVFTVFSDPFNDVRYYGQLKFPYPKNSPPAADDMLKTVAEVLSVQVGDDDKGDAKGGDAKGGDAAPKQKGGGQQQSSAAAPAMAPIAPPPPPTDQPAAAPKTIAKGQSKDVVVASWGQPQKVVKLSAKEIYFYPDMKVTFVDGKVSDVQ